MPNGEAVTLAIGAATSFAERLSPSGSSSQTFDLPFWQLSGLLLVVNREAAWHDEWPQVIPLRAAPVVAGGVAAQSLMYLGPTDGWRLGGVLVSILVAGFTFFVIWRGRRRVHQHGPAPKDPVSVMLVVVLMALISAAAWQLVLRSNTESVPFVFVVVLGILVSAAWYAALIVVVNRTRSRRAALADPTLPIE